MKMVKYFEESGLLMKGVIEKIQSEAKRLRSMLLKERNGVKTKIRNTGTQMLRDLSYTS